jgi:broad specificity phosphatase PhoE
MDTIFLIRHATPEWIRPDPEYQKPPGPALSHQGQVEAHDLGIFLQEAGVQKIYTSPMKRSLQSAQIVADVTGAPMETLEGLSEQLPEERREDVLKRLRPVLQEAFHASQEFGPVALLTHGSPIVYLLSELGMDEEEIKSYRHYDYNNPLPPAGVMQASRAINNGKWTFRLAFVPDQVTK